MNDIYSITLVQELYWQIMEIWIQNWKRVSAVLCDRRMNVKINGKMDRTVVGPTLLVGAETWHANNTCK